jgi:hypothetical protein
MNSVRRRSLGVCNYVKRPTLLQWECWQHWYQGVEYAWALQFLLWQHKEKAATDQDRKYRVRKPWNADISVKSNTRIHVISVYVLLYAIFVYIIYLNNTVQCVRVMNAPFYTSCMVIPTLPVGHIRDIFMLNAGLTDIDSLTCRDWFFQRVQMVVWYILLMITGFLYFCHHLVLQIKQCRNSCSVETVSES